MPVFGKATETNIPQTRDYTQNWSQKYRKEWETNVLQEQGDQRKLFLSQDEYQSLLNGEKTLSDFMQWRLYSTLFMDRNAISDDDRGRLWVILLDGKKHMNSAAPGMYNKLVNMENAALEKTIDQD